MEYKKIDFEKLIRSPKKKRDVAFSWQRAVEKGVIIRLRNGKELLVRQMEVEDVPQVLAIERVTFTSAWSEAGFFYRLHDRKFNVSLVGLLADRVVCYAVSYAIYEDFHIANLAVSENFRRQGFGEVLLWISLHIGVELNCTIAHLEVRKSNKPAIRLYEKFGFEIYGVRKNYYDQEKEDGILMRKKISWELPYGMV